MSKLLNMKCYNCKFKKDIYDDLNGHHYCEACWDKLVSSCSNCSSDLLKEKAKNDPNDDYTCDKCFKEEITLCYNCEKLKWKDDTREFNSNNYCDDCIYQVAFECEDCSEWFEKDSEAYCGTCSASFCQDCYEDDSCRDEDSYQDQNLVFLDGQKSPLITISRYVGVEIEAENGQKSKLNLPDTFGIKEDGSLDSSGVEVVTPPSKDSALVDNIRLACKELIKCNFQATQSCGLHVHIDLREVQNDYVKLSRILRTFFSIEDVIFAMLPSQRLSSTYCEPLRDQYRFYDFYGRKVAQEFDCTVYQEKDKSRVASYKRDHYNDKRYTSCNFHSTFFRGTLEVRAHSGTQNVTKILNWIELLLKVVDWSIKSYKHSQVEELLKLKATKNKVHLMQKIFKFSPKIEDYIYSRMRHFKHVGLNIDYSLGELPKRKQK